MALSGNTPPFSDPTPTVVVTELNSDDVVIDPNASEQHFEGYHRLQNLVGQRYLEFSLGSHNSEGINGIVQQVIGSIRMRGGRFVVRGIVPQMQSETGQSSVTSICWQRTSKF
jgi:hypothetical protein